MPGAQCRAVMYYTGAYTVPGAQCRAVMYYTGSIYSAWCSVKGVRP